jgi:heme A synthase
MAGPVAGGGEGQLRRFRRLADLTAVVTFLLIVVGGVVRVSESGLGCGPGGSGTKGWPLCGGQVIPLVGNENRIIEFSHRLLATVVVILIGILCYRAFQMRRPQTPPPNQRGRSNWAFRGSLLAGALVLAQAVLGGLTVEHSLAEELVAAHLGTAMVLLGLLLWLGAKARSQAADEAGTRAQAVRGLKPYAATAAVLLFCAIVAGGYMAGTEHFGRAGNTGLGAHEACGKEFPGCAHSGILPFGSTRLVNIQLAHRLAVYLTVLAVAAVIVMILRRRPSPVMRHLAFVLGGLLVLQFVLGVLNVVLGDYEALIAAHLTVASLLWATMTAVTIQVFRVPAPVVEKARAGAREQVAT